MKPFHLSPLHPRRLLAALAVLTLGALLTGCSTVSETGRSQLNLISATEEMQLGLKSFTELKKNTPVSQDAQATARVQRVGQRVAAVASLPNAQWEFVLFESSEPNAFCLPGGKVGVYTGLLPIAKDDAGLATVIGHEVAHATSHHGSERMSQQMATQLGGQAFGALIGGQSQATQGLLMQAYGVAGQVGVLLPYSRKHESEADYIGLLFMAKAGYDPAAAVGFWERFAAYSAQHGGSGTPEFLRTHPLDQTRINDLKAAMPKAKAEYDQAKAAGK
jgi:predicted Zn-dependent protease